MTAIIRRAKDDDFDAIWPIFRSVVARGDTYAYPPAITPEQARYEWLTAPARSYVACRGEDVVGTYMIKSNQQGPGQHVCNCGYMVAPSARRQGLATLMCEHSLQVARDMGYKAMQFNLVVETNTGAVKLWQRLGFDIVGTIPKAFEHPEHGFVGAHVMFQWLTEASCVSE